jgi:arsenate reductase
MSRKKRVLFVCVENSCRSQMAEAFVHLYAGEAIEAYSAGSSPSGRVDPRAFTLMAELGYDLSQHASKSLQDIPQDHYDYVVTMGCGDACPFIPADHREDWDLPDPKALPLEQFRRVRDQIGDRVRVLLNSIHQETA